MAENKATFAPVPARAVGDKRLSAADLRTLMAISLHDRMGRNGTGCYASATRLATIAECNIKALSRSIRTLAECGYLIGKKNPLSPRSYVYSVVFNDLDAGFAKPDIGSKSATHPAETGSNPATETADIGNSDFEESEQNQSDADDKISCETINTFREPVNKFGEPASNAEDAKKVAGKKGDPKSVGAILAMLERWMKFDPSKLDSGWLAYLDKLCGADPELDINDPNYHRAQRLYETWGEAA